MPLSRSQGSLSCTFEHNVTNHIQRRRPRLLHSGRIVFPQHHREGFQQRLSECAIVGRLYASPARFHVRCERPVTLIVYPVRRHAPLPQRLIQVVHKRHGAGEIKLALVVRQNLL